MRFQLGDYVPYLLSRAGVSLAHNLSRELDRFGITLPMWRVMAALLDEGEQRLGDLARLTAIELSTLSRIAASMEAKALVTRRRSGQDARAVLVALTAEGRRMAEGIVPHALHSESEAIAGMSEEEVRTLKGLLQRLYGNVAGEAGFERAGSLKGGY
ncbi:MarR family winged helix-turn-helix transcriptional regulator [Magnetospirillum sp. UT-4]|uniref:MarR family winged helix-turn-helix transcriptional regulator n=1 Tax=Magnetospirillum sp. UT-4 TaxID=2681467 RepID=UPI00137D6A30|nr:MarR family transcriptional regulator [Magnetospirillum sp. UT-4]CAA7623947.1 Transcriptional regulator, MarR family [Magnetospirillum sp. UT-4]